MADAIDKQIEEIKTLTDRSLAYSSLLQLHRHSANDPPSMEALSLLSSPLVPILLSDIHQHDEEVAAQALKCLGFMLYHPSLVTVFSEGVAEMVLESLAKLIMSTNMKAICNLGVWCITIQQLGAEVVGSHIEMVLRAVVYALDNPFGSPSATFEAIQAVMKLTTEFCGKMRDMSSLWVPPIYRRLISNDKRERDMAERCLLKAKSIICPPSLNLSKAVMLDLKKKLLPSMLDMLHDNRWKVKIIQAWGWYICLIGSCSLKNTHLVNELLKVPERTFTDPDPQIQIASLVAWGHLVDSLLSQRRDHEGNFDNQVNGLLKRLKLLVVPIQGIISSKSDILVLLSCLKTWHYLLHKLDLSINHPAVTTATFWPILEIIFSKGLDNNENICLWSLCLDLLYDYVLSKVRAGEMEVAAAGYPCVLSNGEATLIGPFADSMGLRKAYPIKWLPWNISSIDPHLKMIGLMLSQGLRMTVNPENRKLALSAALKIFKSVLQGVQVEFEMLSTPYDKIQLCITTILGFMKEKCEDMTSKHSANQSNDLLWLALKFVEAVREELDSSILASPLYQVNLDIKYIKNNEPLVAVGYAKAVKRMGISSLDDMDMVLPVVYMTILQLCVEAQFILNLSEEDVILLVMHHSKLFSLNPLVNLHAVNSFLYMHMGKAEHGMFCWLIMWKMIAKGLMDKVGIVGSLYSKTGCDDASYTVLCWFLCYPFVMLSNSGRVLIPKSIDHFSDLCLVCSERKMELEHVIEVWKSLLVYLNCESPHKSNGTEGLSQLLIRVLDENNTMVAQDSIDTSLNKAQKIDFLLVFGEFVICILEHTQVVNNVAAGSAVANQESCSPKQHSPIKSSLELVARFLESSVKFVKVNPRADHVVICRVFAAMACLVDHLSWKPDILLLMELISDPLLQWLSWSASICGEMQQGHSTIHQLQCLWEQILECMQRCQPPIVFDSSFLSVQGSLLQKSLDHPYLPISGSAIAFWKATYGQNVDLNYPHCLLPVLDKLSRSGRISLQKESPLVIANNGFRGKKVACLSQKRSSPLNIVEEPGTDKGCVNVVTVSLSRKSLKLAKHPRDLKGVKVVHVHGRKVCDYPERKEELRKADHILEMLRRA